MVIIKFHFIYCELTKHDISLNVDSMNMVTTDDTKTCNSFVYQHENKLGVIDDGRAYMHIRELIVDNVYYYSLVLTNLIYFCKAMCYDLAISNPLAVNTFNSATYGFRIAAKMVWFGASETAFFVVSDLNKNLSLIFGSKLFSLNFIST